MPKPSRVALALLCALACPHDAPAQTPPARAEPGIDERPCRLQDAYCRGYVAGILDSLHVAGRVCLPDALPPPRIQNTVRDWLAGHPQLVSQAGAELIANALMKSFPCK